MSKYSEESEKALERRLVERAREYGALALKYYNPYSTGWPDRVVLFRNGLVAWVELKSKGEKPRPLQSHRANMLREMSHHVYTCDTPEKIDRMLRTEFERCRRIGYALTGKLQKEKGGADEV